MTSKYSRIEVSRKVYINSGGHAFVDVRYDVTREPGRYKSEFSIGHRVFMYSRGEWRGPQYMVDAIMDQLRVMYGRGDLVFYEMDRDGNRRYENLRYFDREQFEAELGIGDENG